LSVNLALSLLISSLPSLISIDPDSATKSTSFKPWLNSALLAIDDLGSLNSFRRSLFALLIFFLCFFNSFFSFLASFFSFLVSLISVVVVSSVPETVIVIVPVSVAAPSKIVYVKTSVSLDPEFILSAASWSAT